MKPLTSSLLVLALSALVHTVCTCRVGSELLKVYARQTVENLLDANYLESIYWPNEPLESDVIVRATGVNVTLAETRFQMTSSEQTASLSNPLIRDIFVTCSVDRERIYALAMNLEIDNPFKTIDIEYEVPLAAIERENKNSIVTNEQAKSSIEGKRQGRFRIHLPQSSFLIQLTQRIKYDECIAVNYVQLAPNVNYEIECRDCNAAEQKYLDKIFSKRMTQFDAELDSLLSEKLLLGIQLLINQQRLDLELHMD